jgi:hypothetical protein
LPRKRKLPPYFEQSRDLLNSLVLVLPLLAVYEAAIFVSGTPMRNRFDFLSRLIAQIGPRGLAVFNAVLIVAGAVAVAVLSRKKRLNASILPTMIGESLVYAAALGAVVMFVLTFARHLLETTPPHPAVSLGLAVGAGVYEEFAFRLVLMGLVFLFLQRAVKWETAASLIAAIIFSSVIFSLSHFNKPGLADFNESAFFFRFAAGIFLALIFYFRGFGIAVYTHALYNVILEIGPK